MAKNKISEYSSTPANNTDIGGINIAEGCAPSGINNAIRELMAQLKDQQAGTDGDSFTVGGNLTVSSTITANSSVGTAGQALVSRGAGLSPQWGTVFVSGMIMMWSGSIASIPAGWLLCDGSSGTPDLRDRFVIGARQDNSGVANTNVTGSLTQTGGSKDAIVVSHTHTATVNSAGTHTHPVSVGSGAHNVAINNHMAPASTSPVQVFNPAVAVQAAGDHTHTLTINSAGSSGTNANLVPYFALAFIQKS